MVQVMPKDSNLIGRGGGQAICISKVPKYIQCAADLGTLTVSIKKALWSFKSVIKRFRFVSQNDLFFAILDNGSEWKTEESLNNFIN